MKALILSCILFAVASLAAACGVNWGEPRSHFEGCNEQGYVLISEKLAELTIPGGKSPIPIWATFDSSRQTPSPYAGMGWRIPFLECSLVQLSESDFQMLEPSGWRRLFRRDGKDATLLNGSGGWKGQLAPDKATLWADCGWRFDFSKGKITQIKTPQNQTLVYNYKNGRVSSITCVERTLISVDAADGLDGSLGIMIEGKRYSLTKTDQPRVQRVAGVNIVSGNDASLAQFTVQGFDHRTRTFAYSVDEKIQPVMTITKEATPSEATASAAITPPSENKTSTSVAWNPETKRITRYGEWKYDIKPHELPRENAAIGRTNSKGQREFWFDDGPNGQEIVQNLDGVKKITTWFVGGNLAGRVKKVEHEIDGKISTIRQLIYGDDGRLLREIGADGTVELFTYDKNGTRISSKHPIPTPQELDARETTLRQIIETSPNNLQEKQNTLYDLALFYIGRRNNFTKARELAHLIEDPQRRFNVILQSYDYNLSLKPQEKILHYQRLLREFPEQRGILEELIQIRKTE